MQYVKKLVISVIKQRWLFFTVSKTNYTVTTKYTNALNANTVEG